MQIRAPAPGRLHHHHHRLRHRRYGHHRHEGGRAGVHRQALQSGGDLAAGEPHHQGEEPAAREHHPAQEARRASTAFHDVVSKNPRMQEILALAREIASLRSTVLIQGESGTGKELVARAIHNSGDRASKPFVAVSCAALAETLLESELFGHEKGSFTGANAAEARQVRDGRQRHHLPGRDRRHLAEAAGGPAARAAGTQLLPGRRQRGGAGGCARDRGHHVNLQQAVAEGTLPRRSLLPAQRDRDPHSRRCASAARTFRCWPSHFVERLSHELGKDVERDHRGRADDS